MFIQGDLAGDGPGMHRRTDSEPQGIKVANAGCSNRAKHQEPSSSSTPLSSSIITVLILILITSGVLGYAWGSKTSSRRQWPLSRLRIRCSHADQPATVRILEERYSIDSTKCIPGIVVFSLTHCICLHLRTLPNKPNNKPKLT